MVVNTKQEYSTHRKEKNAVPLNPSLLKMKNFFKFGRRWSSNPQKQLCFNWLSKIFARSDEFETTLDVACGNLNNYPFIKSKNYIGVDMNVASLKYGERVYPNARTELLLIEELDGAGLKGDLVLCTQTVGVNEYFNSKTTMQDVQSLINATNAGGTLVFDIGSYSIQFSEEITKLLEKNFSTLEVKKFGSHDRSSNTIASIYTAYLMEKTPKMAIEENSNRRFYVAEDKLPSKAQ